jgi:hypothetical protein
MLTIVFSPGLQIFSALHSPHKVKRLVLKTSNCQYEDSSFYVIALSVIFGCRGLILSMERICAKHNYLLRAKNDAGEALLSYLMENTMNYSFALLKFFIYLSG